MRVIVPGGYYSYDSAGKKIWLDYQYYGTTLENIERIKNLTRNKILYDYKRSTVLPIVSNGCITHSYSGTEADTDKIQVTLKTPITNSLTELEAVDGVVTLETDGKVLVLPTEDAAILPSFNQSVLDPNRLTIAESPFGGLKGSGSPDYAPGTLFCQTDGVYLTDLSGTNSTKTLTAGKLKELSLLTVDTDAHTITEEFIVENSAESNNPTVIDSGDSAVGWGGIIGKNHSISSDGTKITVTGTTDEAGQFAVSKTISIDMSNKYFYMVGISDPVGGRVYQSIGTDESNRVSKTNCVISPNVPSFVICAAKSTALANSGGGNTEPAGPTSIAGTVNWSNVTHIRVGITGRAPLSSVTFSMYGVAVDTAKSAYIELQTPDNLADSSLTLQTWDGTAYQTTGTYKLDSTYSAVSTTTANWKLADGTKFDDCYGSGLGRALFPKGVSAETKAGSSGSITYSANKGTSKRIGFRVDLPPSDGGRTNFNKCRMKAVLSYTDTVGNVVPDLSGNNNTGTLVGGVTKLNDGGLQFDGVNGAISHGNMCGSGYIKVSADVIFTSIPSAHRYVISKHGSWYMGLYNGLFMARIIIGGVDRMVTYNAGITTNTLYTLEMEYDGEYINGWINGTRVIHSNYPGTMSTASSILYVGREDVYSGYIQETVHKYAVYQNDVLKISCIPTVSNMGSTTHQFADSTNTSYGLQNLSKPWIALYDPTSNLIDFYLFTYRPKNLEFKRDESGTIYEVKLYPGNGLIYHGQITFSDLTRDTNSDSVPDCLEASINGSVTKFLQNYSMVI